MKSMPIPSLTRYFQKYLFSAFKCLNNKILPKVTLIYWRDMKGFCKKTAVTFKTVGNRHTMDSENNSIHSIVLVTQSKKFILYPKLKMTKYALLLSFLILTMTDLNAQTTGKLLRHVV